MDEYKLSTELKAEFPSVGSYIGSLFKKMGEDHREEKENTTKVSQETEEQNQESKLFMQ